jgi:hypothetical protein
VNFPEYVGATRRHLYGVFNCFRLSNMAAAKPEIYFFIVFFTSDKRSSPSVRLKIHFTDLIHVFGVGELNGAIEKAP